MKLSAVKNYTFPVLKKGTLYQKLKQFMKTGKWSKWVERIPQEGCIEMTFIDPKDELNIIPSYGVIRGEKKLLEKITEDFINNKLTLGIIHPLDSKAHYL